MCELNSRKLCYRILPDGINYCLIYLIWIFIFCHIVKCHPEEKCLSVRLRKQRDDNARANCASAASRLSSLYVARREKKIVTSLFGKLRYPLSQTILCTNTFSHGIPANVRSKAMTVADVKRSAVGEAVPEPNDKYDKPSRKSHGISTLAYNLTIRAVVRRYRRRFAKGIVDDNCDNGRTASMCLRNCSRRTTLDGDSRKWNLRERITVITAPSLANNAHRQHLLSHFCHNLVFRTNSNCIAGEKHRFYVHECINATHYY